jgi:hypothetical protein
MEDRFGRVDNRRDHEIEEMGGLGKKNQVHW